jgi:hypothetical protein
MKCKAGDAAVIVFSLRPENVGRIVKVVEYIGKFDQGEHFQFRGMDCQCAVADHFWWIEASDLAIGLGPSPRAYIPDTWLEPIKAPTENRHTSVEEKNRRYEHG